jgi:hypothetical protein
VGVLASPVSVLPLCPDISSDHSVLPIAPIHVKHRLIHVPFSYITDDDLDTALCTPLEDLRLFILLLLDDFGSGGGLHVYGMSGPRRFRYRKQFTVKYNTMLHLHGFDNSRINFPALLFCPNSSCVIFGTVRLYACICIYAIHFRHRNKAGEAQYAACAGRRSGKITYIYIQSLGRLGLTFSYNN